MHRVHQDEKLREELTLDLDEIARQGARRMLAKALEAEVEFQGGPPRTPWGCRSASSGRSARGKPHRTEV